MKQWVLLALLGVPQQQPAELYKQGVELFQQGNAAEALRVLDRAVKADPKFVPAWKVTGVIYASQNDYPMAEPAFREACSLNPKLEDACFYHGRVLYLLNRFEEALLVLGKLVKPDPRVHRIRALSLDGLGRWAEAEVEYKEAMRVRETAAEAAVDYGVALMRQGRTGDALTTLVEAVKKQEQSSRAHLELGRAYLQTERLEDARAELERAVNLDPRSGQAHLLLGKTYLRLGKEQEAGVHLRLGAQIAR